VQELLRLAQQIRLIRNVFCNPVPDRV
jgi:hypothetical protein